MITYYYYLILKKKYWNKEQVSCELVGHPLLDEREKTKIDLNQIIGKNKALISVFAGSRESEINILMPILLDFIELMNKKYNDMTYVFHSTKDFSELMQSYLQKSSLSNCEIISDDKIKFHILQKSVFAIAKSGTVSLEICNAKIPSIILYKMGLINFFILKMFVKTKFANILNFAANEEIIPELLQSNCNAKNIFEQVDSFLENPEKIKSQVEKVEKVLNTLKTDKSSSELASLSLLRFL